MKKSAILLAALIAGWLLLPGMARSQPLQGEKPPMHTASDEDAAASPDPLFDGFGDDSDTAAPADALLEGFEETSADDGGRVLPQPQAARVRLEGALTFTGIYNFSADARDPWQGWSLLRPELMLVLNHKFSDQWRLEAGGRAFYDTVYGLRDRDRYTDQVLDEYERELELQEVFIQGRITRQLDVKAGRQIVVWGTLDNLRVADVLNPLDMRVPGLTDVEDLRLPVTMLKLDYYWGPFDISAICIPELRFAKQPVFGSDFYAAPSPPPPWTDPEEGFEQMQYAAAITGVFSGWDIGFYGAQIYPGQATVQPLAASNISARILRRERIHLLAAAANFVYGNWLFKSEIAWREGLQYTHAPGIDFNRIDAGAGVEYSGFDEMNLSIEVANRYTPDYEPQLSAAPDGLEENMFQWALRLSKDFFNETLTLTLLASGVGAFGDKGALQRLDVAYDISDALVLRGGVVLYQSGDNILFENIGANDRVFAELKYSF